MAQTTGVCLIALTYKRKILLKRPEDNHNIVNKNSWSFIEETPNGRQSFESAIKKEVQKETSIALSSVDLLLSLSTSASLRHDLFHACLTDKEVNSIQRQEGQDLQFFTMKEIEKLMLSSQSEMLFAKSKSMIEASFAN